MNKLILLNEVRREKIKYGNKLLSLNKKSTNKENYEKPYVIFEKKFECLQNKEGIVNYNNGIKAKYSNSEKNLNKIMERIFSLKNHAPIIDFINSIYNDDLSKSANIKYIKNKEIDSDAEVIILKDSNYNLKILAEDEYKKFEYRIQFQVKDEQNIGIIISKKDLSNNYHVVSLNKKRKEHVNANNLKEGYNKCLIMLNSNIEIPDAYEFEVDCEGNDVPCKVNIIKNWKYDFKQLFENNMYLLIPTKIIDLIKIASWVNDDSASREQVKDEMIRFYKDMNRYLIRVKDNNLMADKDIYELNLIATDLLEQIIKDNNNILLDIKREIEVALKDIVV